MATKLVKFNANRKAFVIICVEIPNLLINWKSESLVVFVQISDLTRLIKRSVLKSSRVNNLRELTGNIFKRFQSDNRDDCCTFFAERFRYSDHLKCCSKTSWLH